MTISFLGKFGNKAKLYFFLVVLGFISSGIVLFAVFSVDKIADEVREVKQEVFPQAKVAIEMRGKVGQVIAKLNMAKAAASERALDEVAPLHQEVETLLGTLSDLAVSQKARAETDKLREVYEASHAAGIAMVEASIDQEFVEEMERAQVFDEHNKLLLATLAAIVDDRAAHHASAMQYVHRLSTLIKRNLFIAFGVMTLIGILVLFLIARMSRHLEAISTESAQAVESLFLAMANVAQMADQLAIETSSSASSLDEISVTFEQMNQQANDNAELAKSADVSTKEVMARAEQSGAAIDKVVAAMASMGRLARRFPPWSR